MSPVCCKGDLKPPEPEPSLSCQWKENRHGQRVDKCESAVQTRSLSRDYSCLSEEAVLIGGWSSTFSFYFSVSACMSCLVITGWTCRSCQCHWQMQQRNFQPSLHILTQCAQSWQALKPLLLLTQTPSRVHCNWHLHGIQILHVIIQATTVHRINFSPDAKKATSCTMIFC